jgi:hypothetical protein
MLAAVIELQTANTVETDDRRAMNPAEDRLIQLLVQV